MGPHNYIRVAREVSPRNRRFLEKKLKTNLPDTLTGQLYIIYYYFIITILIH